MPAAQPAGRPVEIAAQRQPLDPEDRARERLGGLTYRGGLALTSPAPDFGGFSGLLVEPGGGRLTAVSDEGRWLTARPRYDAGGGLVGLDRGRMGRLLEPEGKVLARKRSQDAEALTRLDDGSVLVAFERDHRIWRYGPAGGEPLSARPTPAVAPSDLTRLPENHGLEALATLADGRILALSQDADPSGRIAGWIWDFAAWRPLPWSAFEGFEPSGAARLPDGRLLVLERSYSLLGGVAVRLLLLEADSLRPGVPPSPRPVAELRPPLTVDNFEAVDAVAGPHGETLIYLLSDDNFNPLQRTLLLLFELKE